MFSSSTVNTQKYIPHYPEASSDTNAVEILNRIAGIETAINEESERRLASFDLLRDQLDARIRLAVQRLTDETQNDMARLYRRMDADFENRFQALSKEFMITSSATLRLNRHYDTLRQEWREMLRTWDQTTKRMVFSGMRTGNRMADQALCPIEERDRLFGVGTDPVKEPTEPPLGNPAILRELALRIERIEEWLTRDLTSEILRLKENLIVERNSREDQHRDVMKYVGQYADVMQRHIESMTNEEDIVTVHHKPLYAPGRTDTAHESVEGNVLPNKLNDR
jgi:hypothetical protein